MAQNQKETLYLKLQRIAGLTTRYTQMKGESAYNLGVAYAKKGDAAQAREYLLEACRTVPFSLDPASVWMKSKTSSQHLESRRRVLSFAAEEST